MLELLLIPLFRLKQVHHILQLIYILLLACVCMLRASFVFIQTGPTSCLALFSPSKSRPDISNHLINNLHAWIYRDDGPWMLQVRACPASGKHLLLLPHWIWMHGGISLLYTVNFPRKLWQDSSSLHAPS
jgi:hypothetical protein